MSTQLHRDLDSPIGTLRVVSSADGLVRIEFIDSPADTAALDSGDPAAQNLNAACTQLQEYFAGNRTKFDLPIDPAVTDEFYGQSFQGKARTALKAIAFGTLKTYGELARDAGNPDAVRAAGTACATNPLPIVVPCHRITRSDGTIGQYLGGTDAKRYLIDFERRVAGQDAE